MTSTHDIIISGAGTPGLTLALLLADFGLNVALLEPYPPKSAKDTPVSGRTIAILNSSINIIKHTGTWDEIQPHATPMHVMRIIDESVKNAERIEAPFDAFDIGQSQFGFNIPNNLLRAHLYERAQAHERITLFNHGLEDLRTDQVLAHITLDNAEHTPLSAPLIVGADGRKSPVREQAGIAIRTKDYGQSAITCIINHSKAHENTSTEFHRPGGPLALVPMPGNQSSIVWVEKTARANDISTLPKSTFEQELQNEIGNILGGITLETEPEIWPLHTLNSTAITADRVALVAETAHVMSPVTAQGLNLSLRDVASLAEVIADTARLGLDIGSKNTLRAYERRRMPDIKTRTTGVDGMNQMVAKETEIMKRIRRTGLKLVHRTPIIKEQAMQHGLNPQLDMGRLASGGTL